MVLLQLLLRGCFPFLPGGLKLLELGTALLHAFELGFKEPQSRRLLGGDGQDGLRRNRPVGNEQVMKNSKLQSNKHTSPDNNRCLTAALSSSSPHDLPRLTSIAREGSKAGAEKEGPAAGSVRPVGDDASTASEFSSAGGVACRVSSGRSK